VKAVARLGYMKIRRVIVFLVEIVRPESQHVECCIPITELKVYSSGIIYTIRTALFIATAVPSL